MSRLNFDKVLVTGGSGFIGTNLIEELDSIGCSIMNIDILPPRNSSQAKYWTKCDIRDQECLARHVLDFLPDVIFHLAAKTDLDGTCLEDYSSNTLGTSVLMEVLGGAGFAGSVVLASSMYVCRPGYVPKSELDYCPHTIYGESKMEMESIIRKKNPPYKWVIVRPTSIWGPWFSIPYVDFFNTILAGRYMHIEGVETQKTYGYVGNTTIQMISIAEAMDELVGRIVYLGDWPAYTISEWANEIAGLVGKRPPVVPLFMFKMLASFGDLLKKLGIGFPMTSFRLSNMMTSNVHDLSLLKSVVGNLPFSRIDGTRKTLSWLGHDNKK